MNEMVEKVQAAIRAALEDALSEVPEFRLDSAAKDAALAAIQAMREPTEAMVEQGVSWKANGVRFMLTGGQYRDVYCGMLDAPTPHEGQ